LVDDRAENLFALEKLLQDEPLEIFKASSGNEALARALERDYACILLDVQMPEIDGFEVAKLLRQDEATAHIPLIFVTAFSREYHDVFRGYTSGAVDYLMKPLDPTIVVSKVRVFADLFNQKSLLKKQSAELSKLNNELERFSAIASHDLKEPVRTLGLYCQLLERSLDDRLSKKEQSLLSTMTKTSMRMQRLIDDLLTFSKVKNWQKPTDTISSDAVLDDLLVDLEELIRDSQTTIKRHPLPALKVSAAHLRQLFQNFVVNSIRYRRDLPPEIEISAKRDEESWVFAFKDNGQGIESRHLAKVFDAFSRFHDKEHSGSGLGLSICKQIVDRYDGKIWLDSQPGVGTTMFFSVPAN